MDTNEAERILDLHKDYTEEDIQSAYITNVKSKKNDANFDLVLKKLNIARDILSKNSSLSNALVPVIAKELSLVNQEQKKWALKQEAKEDFSDSVVAVENRLVGRIRQSRDSAGLLGAVSAGLAFFRENISELMGTPPLSPSISQGLLVTSAVFAAFAFLSHRRSKNVQNRIAKLKKTLTRQRNIDRILGKVFVASDSLNENSFELALRDAISSITGIRSGYTENLGDAFESAISLYAAMGIPIGSSLTLSPDFIEDYIDFLIRSDHVATYGLSGRDLLITRKKD